MVVIFTVLIVHFFKSCRGMHLMFTGEFGFALTPRTRFEGAQFVRSGVRIDRNRGRRDWLEHTGTECGGSSSCSVVALSREDIARLLNETLSVELDVDRNSIACLMGRCLGLGCVVMHLFVVIVQGHAKQFLLVMLLLLRFETLMI